MNDTHHALVCSCGEQQEQEHSGGEANCKDLAVCEICQTSYGALNAKMHAGGTELRDVKTAEEFAEGYTGDTYCLGCNTQLEHGESIPATHEHTYDQYQSLNETYHEAVCSCDLRQQQKHSLNEQHICEQCGFQNTEPSEKDALSTSPLLFVALGGGALVIAIAVTVFLKKKKGYYMQ